MFVFGYIDNVWDMSWKGHVHNVINLTNFLRKFYAES